VIGQAESEIMIAIEFEPVVNGCDHEGYPTKIAVLVVAIRDLLFPLIVRVAIAIVTGHLLLTELAYQKGTVDGLCFVGEISHMGCIQEERKWAFVK